MLREKKVLHLVNGFVKGVRAAPICSGGFLQHMKAHVNTLGDGLARHANPTSI